MRCIIKKGHILDNSGETIVEVMVAFTLLSIMLVMFSQGIAWAARQGIAWAARSEMFATRTRQWSDRSMKDFQHSLATEGNRSDLGTVREVADGLSGRIKREQITRDVDGQAYTFVFYEAAGV